MSASSLATLLVVSVLAAGCRAERPLAAPVAPVGLTVESVRSPAPAPAIVRFDFVVTKTGRDGPVETSFSLDLEEGKSGEIFVGTNAPIPPAPTDVIRSSVVARQDLGMRVKGVFWNREKGILLELQTEDSGLGSNPTTSRRVRSASKVLLTPGQPTVVAQVDSKRGQSLDHFDLTVTSAKR